MSAKSQQQQARSAFAMQIVHRETGDVVATFEPGGRVETDLIEDFITRIDLYGADMMLALAKRDGIGFFKTEASVELAFRRAWKDYLYSTVPEVWRDMLLTLKRQVRPPQPGA